MRVPGPMFLWKLLVLWGIIFTVLDWKTLTPEEIRETKLPSKTIFDYIQEDYLETVPKYKTALNLYFI